ncbi:hypothetical protein GCM10023084_25750 [Streptomyces lacrimifluminis]|uniref:OAA-family lectin sugar binding domain-containing protein n=1 Tax=Streptomyces lacrimifluminis TaxID=1500077 RepID=A0A917KJE6_9ACTN|nr:hypothetical protein [Streptomyces lacrimifluminis]GGJ13677.1 hypothetical protein GCM10012282_07500 [Streptomyces lacrimifluminis]
MLYRITLDSVHDRGCSERALDAEAGKPFVFSFSSERRVLDSASWESAPRLRFHVDRGEQTLPSQLSWRGADGAEATVSFASGMSGFYGSYRAADGAIGEFRGSLTERLAFSEGPADMPVLRFRTEEGWGGSWHASSELRLLSTTTAHPWSA